IHRREARIGASLSVCHRAEQLRCRRPACRSGRRDPVRSRGALMAKREQPTFAFIRRGDALVPELAMDRRALDGVSQGQRVKVEIKEFRSLPRLRAYWGMLHEVVAATECAASAERLHEAMKLELGIVDLVKVG